MWCIDKWSRWLNWGTQLSKWQYQHYWYRRHHHQQQQRHRQLRIEMKENENVIGGKGSYTTDPILLTVDDLNSVRERRGLSCRRSRARHTIIQIYHTVCIYLAWEKTQWDFYAVHPVGFVVRTCPVPEIFITGIMSQPFSASAPGAYNTQQANKGISYPEMPTFVYWIQTQECTKYRTPNWIPLELFQTMCDTNEF